MPGRVAGKFCCPYIQEEHVLEQVRVALSSAGGKVGQSMGRSGLQGGRISSADVHHILFSFLALIC